MTRTTLVDHLVIRASAGTGKTFQLAHRFIGLIAGGSPPDVLLAATFARKAAGEILDRVVHRLAEAALDPAKLAELNRFIPRPLDRPTLYKLLRQLLQGLHRLRISTLDSFFIQLAGHYGWELDLPPGWRIIDPVDESRLRDEAIRRALGGDFSSEAVTLFQLLSKGAAARSVTQQMRDAVDQLYDLFRVSPAEAWFTLPRRRELEPEALAGAFQTVAVLAWSDQRFAKAHQADLKHLQDRDWEALVKQGLAGAIAQGKDRYYNKPFEAAALNAYQPIIDHARAVLVNRIAQQTEATRRLLERYHESIVRVKHEQRVLGFSDVTRTLAESISRGVWQSPEFRLDAHVDHLLLDEFQDTSLEQWNVLRPFAMRITSAERRSSLFCVGDVKQAIYGWRGGVSEIFEAIHRELPALEESQLVESHRSSPIIIETVNEVFTRLRDNPALADHPAAAERWQGRFEPHSTARRGLPGHARLVVAPYHADWPRRLDATCAFAAAEVARLAQEHPGRSIGVLVRRNQTVARLMALLRSEHGLTASGEGGNPLTDSLAVQVAMSALKLADHPGDTIARFHVAHSPLATLTGILDHEDESAVQAWSCTLRQLLLSAGYGATIDGWVPALSAACDARELGRLRQLVELGFTADAMPVPRSRDFLHLVEQKRIEDPRAAPIRVMTVHQSKGLQFDLVVLPELDVALKGQPPSVVIGRKDRLADIERICRYTSSEVQSLLPSEFQRMFDEWPEERVEESLCVLYVALTRAIHALHMIVQPPPNKTAGEGGFTLKSSSASLLRGALAPEKTLEPGAILWEHGDPQWSHTLPPLLPEVDDPRSETIHTLSLAPPRLVRRDLERRSPSSLKGSALVRLADRLRPAAESALRTGSIIHAWLAEVAWLDEEPSLETARLATLAAPWQLAEEERGSLETRFRSYLTRPTTTQVLARRGIELTPLAGAWAGATLELHRERPFALREGDAILQGTIDRLVLARSGARVIGAWIVDFKTDQLADDAALAGAVEAYQPQLEAYRLAVAQGYRLERSAIVASLLFLERDALRFVTAHR